MREYKVNKNDRVTIPHQLWKKFGIEKGTKVYFTEERDGIKIIPITFEVIHSNIGYLNTKGIFLKTLKKEKDRESTY